MTMFEQDAESRFGHEGSGRNRWYIEVEIKSGNGGDNKGYECIGLDKWEETYGSELEERAPGSIEEILDVLLTLVEKLQTGLVGERALLSMSSKDIVSEHVHRTR
jgi:hypothetical protein